MSDKTMVEFEARMFAAVARGVQERGYSKAESLHIHLAYVRERWPRLLAAYLKWVVSKAA